MVREIFLRRLFNFFPSGENVQQQNLEDDENLDIEDDEFTDDETGGDF